MNQIFLHPLVAEIGLAALVLLTVLVYRLRKQYAYRGGVRAANTFLVKEIPDFQKTMRLHRILSVMMHAAILLACAAVILLIARPYREDMVSQGVRKRDIFLCMDTGFYLDDLNSELIDALEDVVRGLSGDRFGISIYSSSSLLYVPMTDDYDFIIMKLEELKEYFALGVKLDQYYGGFDVIPESLQDDYEADYARMLDLNASIGPPTHIDQWKKGPFLTGDGVAACLYSFPKFGEDDRSRVIILSTENTEAVGANPLCRLPEATDLCAKNNVTVFGLFRGEKAFDDSAKANNFFLYDVETDTDYESARAQLDACVRKTGGKMYEYGYMTPAEMVRDIQKQEAMQTDEVVKRRMIDKPEIPVMLLMAGLLAMVGLEMRLRL